MNMHDAVGQAHMWLDWQQFASLPAPSYIAVSAHGALAYVGYQFDKPSDVDKWAQSLALTCTRQRHQTSYITRAILKTDYVELECYHVAPAKHLPTPPSYAATP